MIRQHTPTPLIMLGPLFLAILGGAFCIWSASGNALNFCITTGCALFQDINIAGISLWWYGVAGFGLLAFMSMSGRPWLGVLVAGIFLLVDTILLLLMSLTAPCVGCLFVALIFALCYLAFRRNGGRREQPSRSWLLAVWGVLFVVNLGLTLRMEVAPWAMSGPQEAAVRVYFSPSCSACREAVISLSGRLNTAFYPVAENDEDVTTIAAMQVALGTGASIADAINTVKPPTGTLWVRYNPDMLLLHFRLLRNKAHVLTSGSHTVPFIECQGLPAGLLQKPAGGTAENRDTTLPVDTDILQSCGGASTTPCP